MSANARLGGLDIARFCALAGMVLVNFSVVIGVRDDDPGLAAAFLHLFQGKAAAVFVVLAGIGLGLAAIKNAAASLPVTIKRAGFLFGLGMLNMLIFDADILHYYGVWFLLAAGCLHWPAKRLLIATGLIPVLFVALLFLFDYEAGWQWDTLTYTDLWTVPGFLRHLWFNGWHPVLPWFAFLLWGLWLSRLALHDGKIQTRMIGGGLIVLLLTESLSALAVAMLAPVEPELVDLVGTKPIPPGPLYMLSGMATATMVTGLCLYGGRYLNDSGIWSILAQTGRYSLTFYIAHILLGMGVLEEAGLLDSGDAGLTIMAALGFMTAAVAFAGIWQRFFPQGPIEALMRRMAG